MTRFARIGGCLVMLGSGSALLSQGCSSAGGTGGGAASTSVGSSSTATGSGSGGSPGIMDGGGGGGGGAAPADGSPPDAAGLGPVLMGVDMSGEPAFAAATGLKAQVVRVYLKQGDSIPKSVTAAGLDKYYGAGQAVVYSAKPDSSPDSTAVNQANLAALAGDIKAKGYASKTWIALHHEPFPELTGPAFQAMYKTYAPSVRGAGVPCGVIYQTYPVYHSEPTYPQDYTSGILADVDFIGIDVYPDGSIGGYATDVLKMISPFTSYAKANGKPFQIDEIAVDKATSGTQAAQAAWLGGLVNLGADAQAVMYFEGAPGAFPNLVIENNPQAVTEWQAVYQTLTTR